MRLLPSSRWAVGGLTLAVWALAAGSALFWYLQAGSTGVPTQVAAVGSGPGTVQVDTRAVARTLGVPDASATHQQAAPDITGRLALRGVVTQQGRGAALISVDGKPPVRPLRVGAAVDGVDGWSVRSVSQRTVVIVAEGREARLEMPAMELRSTARDAVAPPPPPPLQPQAVPAPPMAPPALPTPQQSMPGVSMPSGGAPNAAVPMPRAYPAYRPTGV
jgi:general secretion pathway protein C